jgi:nucleotidyltransferase substrate binding protein (TIGR01987 family)
MEQLEKLKNSIQNLKQAIATLEKSCWLFIEWKIDKDIVRDSIIQRFEYVFELSWKFMKEFLEYEWISWKNFPREVIKEMFKKWIIDNLDLWLDLLDTRNKLSHTYSEYSSEIACEFILKNYWEFNKLVNNIQKLIV